MGDPPYDMHDTYRMHMGYRMHSLPYDALRYKIKYYFPLTYDIYPCKLVFMIKGKGDKMSNAKCAGLLHRLMVLRSIAENAMDKATQLQSILGVRHPETQKALRAARAAMADSRSHHRAIELACTPHMYN